jgi:hypothetical protein
MKKNQILVTICLVMLTSAVNSQNIKDYGQTDNNPKFYIGLGTGLNYNCGLLGIKVAAKPMTDILLDFSAGIGTWGNKLGLGIILNAKDENAWSPVLGFSLATGAEKVPLEIEVINPSGVVTTVNENLKFNPATMFNIGVQRQWVRPTGNRITFELGYSILVSGGEVEWVNNPNNYIFNDVTKKVFDFLRPGGLTIGIGYYFALK